MGYTKINDNLSVHQSLSDEPNIDDGLSSEELKKKFDEPAEKLKNAFNNLIDELMAKNSASSIGAMPLVEGDTSEPNVGAKLAYLLNTIQDVTLGQVPDGSITKEKIDVTYRNTLAIKNGTVQTDLNAEKIDGKKLSELASYFMVTGSLADVNENETKTINLGFTPRAVIINSGAVRIGNGIGLSSQLVTTEEKTYFVSFSGDQTASTSLKIVENGFEFTRVDNVDGSRYGTGYRYIAFR